VVLALPEITTPAGNVSVSGALRLSAVVPELLNVMVSVEIPPSVIVAGLKAFPNVGAGLTDDPAHEGGEIVFESIVTAPFCAKALPDKIALVLRVMLVRARMLPTNEVPVPSVAELPTCQKTLHCWAPLINTTEELLPVISVLAILKTKTAFGFPPAFSVSAPVKPADDEKQYTPGTSVSPPKSVGTPYVVVHASPAKTP